jgi:hypothetical protein
LDILDANDISPATYPTLHSIILLCLFPILTPQNNHCSNFLSCHIQNELWFNWHLTIPKSPFAISIRIADPFAGWPAVLQLMEWHSGFPFIGLFMSSSATALSMLPAEMG